MAKLRRLSIIAAAVFITSAAGHANTLPSQSGAASDGHFGKSLATRYLAPVRSTRSWSFDLSGARGSIDRPYARISAARHDGRMPTTVDYRFAPDGMVGSVGYRRVVDSRPMDAHDVNSAAATQFGLPDNTFGATLSYAFDR
ncbi:MAG: hypothetical protein ABI906_07070 [Pseudomonadota bacterium]